jgi:hypothetical protein
MIQSSRPRSRYRCTESSAARIGRRGPRRSSWFNPMKRTAGRARPRPHHPCDRGLDVQPGTPGARGADPDDGPDPLRRTRTRSSSRRRSAGASGVVGIDIATASGGERFDFRRYSRWSREARGAAWVTIRRRGRPGEMGRAEIGEVLELLRPDRIGHGSRRRATRAMKELSDREVVLSCLLTGSRPRGSGVDIFRTSPSTACFHDRHGRPEMMRTHLATTTYAADRCTDAG